MDQQEIALDTVYEIIVLLSVPIEKNFLLLPGHQKHWKSLGWFFMVFSFQVDGITDRGYTAREILKRTMHLAECMRGRFGIKAGDAVGICSENRLEFALTNFAIAALGATIAPFNTTYTEGSISKANNEYKSHSWVQKKVHRRKIHIFIPHNDYKLKLLSHADNAVVLNYCQ